MLRASQKMDVPKFAQRTAYVELNVKPDLETEAYNTVEMESILASPGAAMANGLLCSSC